MYLIYIIVLFICTCNVHPAILESLNGVWNLQNSNNTITGQGNVPGGIYSDLMKIGVLEDIFAGFNDVNYRWVGSESWIYTRDFNVSADFLGSKQMNIVFEGLDTFATIYINDVEIGLSENMFVRYVFDVTLHLKEGLNTISVEFKSPIAEALNLYNEQARNYTVPPDCVPTEFRGECHANHIRKMQASFSWDWGPAFPSVGIWKNVYLESFNVTVIRDFTFKATPNESEWIIDYKTYFGGKTDGRIVGTVIVSIDTNLATIQKVSQVDVDVDANGEFVFKDYLVVPYDYVDLWWPNGYGDQNLYNIDIMFENDNRGDLDEKIYKIGFRTIELIQEPLEQGLSFYFKVNDNKIFMKGTNSIPINILPELGTQEGTIRFLLQSAKDVHMNMIRVWGGGVYESDTFYNIADELGILIWEDFMFACSMYPANEQFLRNVRNEVKHQVRRLQHHASIAIWAGNNENEAALRDNWYGTTGDHLDQYMADYVTLYVDTIKTVVFENDDSRPFLTSSPTNGLKSDEEGHVAENPYDSHYGDLHYYNYISSSWDSMTYPMTRFASEYGFQSLPRLQTLRLATNNSKDLDISSEFMDHRQHHRDGYYQMKMLIEDQFTLPAEDSENYLETFIFLNQISQAMSVKVETEHYRQWRSMLNSNGEGFTMGALYWQLNDVWVAPTWAGIDFDQNWKMLHYFAKKFFSPVLISSKINASRQLTIYSISDLLESVRNVQMEIRVFKWDNLVPIFVEMQSVDILAESSVQLKEVAWVDKYLSENGCGTIINARNHCMIHLRFLDPADGSVIGSDNFVLPTTIKTAVDLQIPRLGVVVIENFATRAGKSFIIHVTTDRIALFVWLDTGSVRGQFTENGFVMVETDKYIGFQSEEPVTAEQLRSSLSIKSYLS